MARSDLEDTVREALWEYDEEIDWLEDIITSAYGKTPTNDNIYHIVYTMPFDDVLDAIKYGFNDTEVRERTYTYLQANPKLFGETE